MPRTASGGMAVEHLADRPSRQRRAAADHSPEEPLPPLAAGAVRGLADVPVAQLVLLGSPGELERPQALLPPVGAPEVQRAHPVLTTPRDRLAEQEVVRPPTQ